MKKLKYKSATFNPLDFIAKDSPLAIDDCNDVAQALVVRSSGEEKDAHWLDSAEEHISTMTATTVEYGTEGFRSLQDVAAILSHPKKLEAATNLAAQSEAWDGMLARKGANLLHYVDEEKSGALTTVGRFLRFLNTPAMAAVTKTSSFNPANLKRGKMTVYIVLPPEHMKAQAGWLRLAVGSMIRAVIREGRSEYPNVHFVLDESASLGVMDAIDDLVDKYRKYGCRGQFYYQSAGQLGTRFRDQGQTLMASAAKIYFGVADYQTATLVSKMLGNETITVEDWTEQKSGGKNKGWSQSFKDASKTGGENEGWSKGKSLKQAPRELLKPEEVLMLPTRTCITFPGGGTPRVLTNLVRYFEEPGLFKPKRLFAKLREAVKTLFGSAFMLVAGIILAALITQAVNVQLNTAKQQQQQYQWQFKTSPERK